MKPHLVGVVIGLVVAGPSWPATTAFLPGASLLDLCDGTGNDRRLDYTQCVSYLSGLIDAETVLSSRPESPSRTFCRPTGFLTVEELRRVFVRYARSRPDEMRRAASVVALDAFSEAWPCE